MARVLARRVPDAGHLLPEYVRRCDERPAGPEAQGNGVGISSGAADLGRKRDLYAEIGVSEYWRYGKTGGDFYGEPMAGECLVDGELRFWSPTTERWLLTQMEEHEGRLEAEGRVAELELELRRLRGE